MSIVISCPRRVSFEQLPHSRRAERRRGNASARVGNRVGNGIAGYGGRLRRQFAGSRRLAYHVTQRVNRLDPVFFEAGDYRLCRRLGTTAARRARREKSSKLSP